MPQYVMRKLAFLLRPFRPAPLLVNWIPAPDMRTPQERAIDEVIAYLEAM